MRKLRRHHATSPRRPVAGILVRVLEGLEDGEDVALLVRASDGVFDQRVIARKHRMAIVARILDRRHDLVGVVEGADRQRRLVIAPAIGQRRTAVRAEAAVHVLRAAEFRRLPARPLDRPDEGDEGRDQIAERLLAHAAIADRGMLDRPLDAKAHGAALAAAGQNVTHGCSSRLAGIGQAAVSWSGC